MEVATELVQTRGYSAFSYQDLSNRLGITKASIHHHFPSKAGLGLAVAEQYTADVKAALWCQSYRSRTSSALTPLARLQKLARASRGSGSASASCR